MAVQRDADEQTGSETERSALLSEVRIDPVEIALPKGVGYTLRAYRPIDDVTPTDVSEREVDEFPDRPRPASDQEEDTLVDAFDDEFDDEEEPADVSDEELGEDEASASARLGSRNWSPDRRFRGGRPCPHHRR